MPSSAVAGMVFPLSQELCQMVKPMTEIELNEEIENLLTESAAGQPSRRTGSAYRWTISPRFPREPEFLAESPPSLGNKDK